MPAKGCSLDTSLRSVLRSMGVGECAPSVTSAVVLRPVIIAQLMPAALRHELTMISGHPVPGIRNCAQ